MNGPSDNKQEMPLYFWGLIFLVAILMILISLFVFNYRTKYLLKLPKKVMEYTDVPKNNSPDIYFIGSSLTRNALIQDSTFKKVLIEKGFTPNFKIDIIGSSTFDDFNCQIDIIKKLHPHYLFIESNLACLKLTTNFRGRLVQLPRNVIIELKKQLHSGKNNEGVASNDTNNPTYDFDNQEIDLSGTIFDVNKIDEFPKWDSLFAEASTLGIKIFLLEIPRSIEAEQQLLTDIKKQQKELIDAYYQKYGIDFIAFPNKISRNNYYIDRAHFNSIGSRYYSEWLVGEFCKRTILNCN